MAFPHDTHEDHSPSSRVVVVTGGTAGIGRAVVREFAQHGHRIAILARDPERLTTTVEEALELGSAQALGLSVDVTNHKAVETAAATIENQLGPIDIWINNAMATVFSPVHRITASEFKRATEVTYLGSVYCTLAALTYMRRRHRGTIVQVGSALAYRGIPLQAPYCGAKFALRGFIDSVRSELMHDEMPIHLTMVQLPAHNTPQFSWARSHMRKHPQPVPPIFQPEVAARAIYWSAFHKRREVWVGKPAVAVIIANEFFPGLVDRYLAVTGYRTQLMDALPEKNWPGNLFKPVKGNFAAHGIFDAMAYPSTEQFIYEKIPLLHSVTDLFFAVTTFIGMIPGFLRILATSKKARREASM